VSCRKTPIRNMFVENMATRAAAVNLDGGLA
jgi:hypothetical protein